MESTLTVEQRAELHRQALLQAEANLENARINFVLAQAARDALVKDGAGEKLIGSGKAQE
jgi:hypothetical protein